MEAPIFIGQLELTDPIGDIVLPMRVEGDSYKGAHLLVRLQHVPIGYVFLQPSELDSAAVARRVWDELGAAINVHYSRAGLADVDTLPVNGLAKEPAFDYRSDDLPLVTVVVCTRDRPDSVMITLRSLLAMHYRPFEVVVVDNAPSSEATRDAVFAAYGENPVVRYVREPRPGLSCARNRGLTEAAGDIVAFTDDDVTADPWWLHGILRGFDTAPDVSCVTGLVVTAQLESTAQLYFHLRSGWGALCQRRIFDLVDNRDDSPLYPYSAGIFGTGANFAVTRALMKEIGAFDEALGAGTVSGGGEDLEMFMRIILSGNRLVYEPAAIVSHFHRTSLAGLTRQMRAYGTGCTAALVAITLRLPRARRELPLRILSGIMRIFTLNDRVQDNSSLPSGLMRQELFGMVTGPWLYLKGRTRLRRRRD